MKKGTDIENKSFNVMPSILFTLSTIVYIVGTFLSWYPGSLYDLSKLNGGVAAFVIPVVSVVAILGILQIINCFAKRNWLRIISGVLGIIVNIISWLTFIGSAIIISNYGSVGIGAYITAAGSIALTIFSIVLLATNKKKNTDY
ncbi:hypothetical protein IJG92_03075 [Candidatus Saccharibacteria bacterium]|nr:hypothetical protein [Candidatus Saccharibacteria bacterium]